MLDQGTLAESVVPFGVREAWRSVGDLVANRLPNQGHLAELAELFGEERKTWASTPLGVQAKQR
jgi:hypothetical protein